MSDCLIEKFKYLPDELIHYIIQYTDVIVYRNGRYMNRINKQDKRYDLLKKISKPYFFENGVYLSLEDYNFRRCQIIYRIYTNITELNISFFDSAYKLEKTLPSNGVYVFNAENKWFNTIHYSM